MNVSELQPFLKAEHKNLDPTTTEWASILPAGWHKFILEIWVGCEKMEVDELNVRISNGVLYIAESGYLIRQRVTPAVATASGSQSTPIQTNNQNVQYKNVTEYRNTNEYKLFKRVCQSMASESAKTCMICGNFGRRRKELEHKPSLCPAHYLDYINHEPNV